MPSRLIIGYSLLAFLIVASVLVLVLLVRRRRAAHALRWSRRGREHYRS
jgi:hypothetical protein